MLLGDASGLTKMPPGPRPTALQHTDLEAYLSRYGGIMLYLREMDENVYSKLCAVRRAWLHSTAQADFLNHARHTFLQLVTYTTFK